MWLFYCHTRYFGSVHYCFGLKILILNGSGLQIQTSGTAPNICWVGWVGTNIRGVGRRMLSNIGVYLQFIWVDVAEETFLFILLEKKVYICKVR